MRKAARARDRLPRLAQTLSAYMAGTSGATSHINGVGGPAHAPAPRRSSRGSLGVPASRLEPDQSLRSFRTHRTAAGVTSNRAGARSRWAARTRSIGSTTATGTARSSAPRSASSGAAGRRARRATVPPVLTGAFITAMGALAAAGYTSFPAPRDTGAPASLEQNTPATRAQLGAMMKALLPLSSRSSSIAARCTDPWHRYPRPRPRCHVGIVARPARGPAGLPCMAATHGVQPATGAPSARGVPERLAAAHDCRVQ